MEAPAIFSPTPYRPNNHATLHIQMYLQIYIPQREQYTVIACRQNCMETITFQHAWKSICMAKQKSMQEPTLAQSDSCQKDCARLAGLKVLASNVLIITSSRRHLPASFPDFISHAAVEIFFSAIHALLHSVLHRLCRLSRYVHNLNNKINCDVSIINFVFIPNC